ncbi:hypothetical protein FHS95_002434 [Sphingomonas naasensis]|uniref:Uncharacterized protein n=1 Tax=Sphingomonas naasensis TaxID=1344951 RepID=A0A4S1WPI2_9SPHN|nr:hypothetical protein [Sphingomonas naasensis]NIJ20742.1 hypothetical protein [Sphingomonas naasensis]TGX43156.1 hypothetical protein E5A74_08215 [Sphingomonas naasensis]
MSRLASGLPVQLLAAAVALGAIDFAPPAEGQMLLMPLAGQGADSLAVWATVAGARIVGPGPLPGSLVVQGSAGTLAGAALRHATLIVAAPPAACGAER